MELNKTLTTTSVNHTGQPVEYFPEFDVHLHRMQKLAFKVGKVVMGQPQGTVAQLSNGEFIGVTEYIGHLETVLLHDYQDSLPVEDVCWFCITPQAYQDPDWGGEGELDEMSNILTDWLAKPVFVTLADPLRLTQLAEKLEQWIVTYKADTSRPKA